MAIICSNILHDTSELPSGVNMKIPSHVVLVTDEHIEGQEPTYTAFADEGMLHSLWTGPMQDLSETLQNHANQNNTQRRVAKVLKAFQSK